MCVHVAALRAHMPAHEGCVHQQHAGVPPRLCHPGWGDPRTSWDLVGSPRLWSPGCGCRCPGGSWWEPFSVPAWGLHQGRTWAVPVLECGGCPPGHVLPLGAGPQPLVPAQGLRFTPYGARSRTAVPARWSSGSVPPDPAQYRGRAWSSATGPRAVPGPCRPWARPTRPQSGRCWSRARIRSAPPLSVHVVPGRAARAGDAAPGGAGPGFCAGRRPNGGAASPLSGEERANGRRERRRASGGRRGSGGGGRAVRRSRGAEGGS